MPIREGNITYHFGPQELGGADDLRAAIVGFLDDAKEELQIAIQELQDEPIAATSCPSRGAASTPPQPEQSSTPHLPA